MYLKYKVIVLKAEFPGRWSEWVTFCRKNDWTWQVCCHACSDSTLPMILWCYTKHSKPISSWIHSYNMLCDKAHVLTNHPGVSQPPNVHNSLWCHWTIYDMTHQDETCNSLTQGGPEAGSKGGTKCAMQCFSEASGTFEEVGRFAYPPQPCSAVDTLFP